MKYFFILILISLSLNAIAQETTTQGTQKSEKPIDNIQQEQEAADQGTVNEFDVGPYDREGNYLNYSRMQEEMKAAKEGKETDQD
jgi:hypothetical protein